MAYLFDIKSNEEILALGAQGATPADQAKAIYEYLAQVTDPKTNESLMDSHTFANEDYIKEVGLENETNLNRIFSQYRRYKSMRQTTEADRQMMLEIGMKVEESEESDDNLVADFQYLVSRAYTVQRLIELSQLRDNMYQFLSSDTKTELAFNKMVNSYLG